MFKKAVVLVVGLVCSLVFAGKAVAQQVFPEPVTDVTASDDEFLTTVKVTWSAATSGPVAVRYLVYRSLTPDFCPNPTENPTEIPTEPSTEPVDVVVNEVAAPSTEYFDTPPKFKHTYYYSVRAVSATGQESDCLFVDGGSAKGYPPPLPPTGLTATKNDYQKIRIGWEAPLGSQPIQGYKLYRADSESASCGDGGQLIADNLGPNDAFFDDTSALARNEGYFYSMKSYGPSAPNGGDCSDTRVRGVRPLTPPPFPPTSVAATDGVYTNKVELTWVPPVSGGPVTNFSLHRSEDPVAPGCASTYVTGFIPTQVSYTDTNVVPGRKYYYSLGSAGVGGASKCSNLDPGWAKIGPSPISATDGTFPDRIAVAWSPPSLGGVVTGYEVFRSENPGNSCSGSLLSGQAFPAETTSFNDEDVVPGKLYYYSIRVLSPTGVSSCLANDGYAVTACSDGLDNDGDGKVDYPDDPGCDSLTDNSENSPKYVCDNGLDDDGDGKIDFKVDGSGDPGCDSPVDPSEDDTGASLKSPVFAKFNTFLGQWNYAELINQGTKDQEVTLTLYNLYGQEMIKRTMVIPAASEVDVDVNSLLAFACDVLKSGCEDFVDLSATRGEENGLGRPDGVVDTYGLLKLEFDDSNPSESLLGRISFYRPNTDGSFSFAFARELRNPSSGATYALSNTYDPQGMGQWVPNWAEVIAFGKSTDDGKLELSSLDFTLNIYKQDGSLKESKKIALPALGEFDFQAGHEFLNTEGGVDQDVYLVEVIPHQENAAYFLTVSRYSSNAAPGTDPKSYNFAFSVAGNAGTEEALFAPISNSMLDVQGLKTSPVVDNWVEVANVSTVAAKVTVHFRDGSGELKGTQVEYLAPKSQYHFNASAVLPTKSFGTVEISSTAPVVAQSMSYVHSMASGELSGFSSPARTRGRKEMVGTINTFLGMQDLLHISATTSEPVDANYSVVSFRGEKAEGVIGLNNKQSSIYSLSDNATLSFPPETYGALKLETAEDGQALGTVYRVRVDSKGDIDFVMHTPVK